MLFKPPSWIVDWVRKYYVFIAAANYGAGWEDGYQFRKLNGSKYDDEKYHMLNAVGQVLNIQSFRL